MRVLKVPDTVMACCVLHNICIIQGDEYDLNDDEDENDIEDGGPPSQAANGVREAIVDYLADQ